jgi:hypothetical protein
VRGRGGEVTGRNLHAEAGPGKEWEEVVRREECSEKGTEVPFFPLEQESLFWVFKRKKKKVARRTRVGRSPEPGERDR